MKGEPISNLAWFFHGAITTVFGAIGFMTVLTIFVMSIGDGVWIWPKRRRSETSATIRAGRVVHWGFVGIAGAVLGSGAIITASGNGDWSALLFCLSLGLGLAASGRGVLYILAGE